MKLFAIRKCGSACFARRLPHDFDSDAFVSDWNNPEALTFESEEAAQEAIDADPDGDCLTVETFSMGEVAR